MIRLLFFFIFVVNIAAFGQDSSATRNREFYLTLADFSPLNIHLKYKHQVGEKTYLKFGLVNLSASRSEYLAGSPSNPSYTTTVLSGGVEIGIEFRKQLNDKLSFFHGPNLRYAYQASVNDINSAPNVRNEAHTASIPYTAGVLFNLTPNLLLAAEINPAINFIHNENSSGAIGNSSNTYSFSLDNRGGLLSLVLRF